ncbi:MAG: glycosyltransferase family 1 protein [Salinibacterium sp.]|nr:MAG: glycosyltransferase family 1 protein [Salinibacterium sp.]
MRAIGADAELASLVHYHLVGSIPGITRENLTALAVEHGVTLRIHGRVSDEELAAAIDSSDVICCVRLPSIEAASASAIEAMLSAKPTIVADTGFYSELPDDVVIKIDPDEPESAIAAALKALSEDPAGAKALGDRARNFARKTFTGARYAKALLALAEESEACRGQREIARAFGAAYASWGIRDSSPLIDDVAKLIDYFD